MITELDRFFLFCFFDKNDFNKEQLSEIILGLNEHLSYEKIFAYAIPINSASEMAKMRKNIDLLEI